MRKLIVIIAGIAAVIAIGVAVYLSQAASVDQPSGTSTCAPRDEATKSGDTACEVPGDNGKPGEAPKG